MKLRSGVFNQIAERHMSAAESAINISVKQRAIEAGWPEHLANSLSIEFSNGTSEISYPDEYKKEIEDLEYGTPENPPKAFIRLFNEQLNTTNEMFENIMTESLFESGEIF